MRVFYCHSSTNRDFTTNSATHETGLVVRFRQVAPGVWDGEATEIPGSLHTDPKRAARLMSEAGDIHQEARYEQPD